MESLLCLKQWQWC